MLNKKFRTVGKYIIIFTLIGGVVGGLGYFFYFNPVFLESRTPKRFFWLSAAFTNDSLTILQSNPDKVDMLSPTWYTLNPNGSLTNYRIEETGMDEIQTVMDICTSYEITVHPLVNGGNESNIRSLLENDENQEKFITSLNLAFETLGFQGINIDLEGIPEDLRDEFTSFFQKLRDEMPSNKQLSIDVPAKIKDDTTGWGGWCDYEALGDIADMFMIMTYDYSGGWTEPGEIAPTSWVKSVCVYATKEMALEKIYIGIPFYGYDWSENPSWENGGFGYMHFANKVARYGGTPTRTDDGHELRYEYTDDDGYSHIAYYCDAETTWKKEEFLADYPIGGYCYWHIGCGDREYFEE